MSNTFNGYALLIGIDKYEHLRQLSRAAKDAADVAECLTRRGNYRENQIFLLRDEEATKSTIESYLSSLASQVKPSDTVVVFFSGHGLQPKGGFAEGEFLCPVDVDPKNIKNTAISNEDLSTALSHIKANQVVTFLDACHSGGVGEIKDIEVRAGFSSSTYDLLAASTGRVVIASCKSDEFSYELNKLQNGLFTHYLLEGLCKAPIDTDGEVNIMQLYDYLSRKVKERINKIDKTKQQRPLLKGETESFPVMIRSQQSGSADKTQGSDSLSDEKGVPDRLSDDPGFRLLVPFARKGKIELFLGLGCLEEAGISISQLAQTLMVEVEKLKAEKVEEDPASEITFPEAVEKYLKWYRQRSYLVDILRKEFKTAAKHNPLEQLGAFRLIASVPQINKEIITTYWGSYLKPLLKELPHSSTQEIVYDHQVGSINSRDAVIIKLFGHLDDENSLILTEKDLARFEKSNTEEAHDIWEYVKSRMDQSHCVFVGYQPDSFDFKPFRDAIVEIENKGPHFFVAPISGNERRQIESLGMIVIPTTITEFLIALFRELAEFTNRKTELDTILLHFLSSAEIMIQFA
jgi:hypothetical protein